MAPNAKYFSLNVDQRILLKYITIPFLVGKIIFRETFSTMSQLNNNRAKLFINSFVIMISPLIIDSVESHEWKRKTKYFKCYGRF